MFFTLFFFMLGIYCDHLISGTPLFYSRAFENDISNLPVDFIL